MRTEVVEVAAGKAWMKTSPLDSISSNAPASSNSSSPSLSRSSRSRDWPADWLNSNATQFFPDWGQTVDWKPLYDHDGILVEVAPADALLAMKLRAAMSHPGRDAADIVSLVAELDIHSAEDAESIFSAYYPSDGLNERVYALVERAVANRGEFQVTVLPDVHLNPKPH